MDGNDVLNKLDNLDIPRWNYKKEDPSIMHIGPIAQDFYSTFNVGNNNTTVSTIDPAGIALVGVKALHKQTKDLQDKTAQVAAENEELKAKVAELSTNNSALLDRLAAIESRITSMENCSPCAAPKSNPIEGGSLNQTPSLNQNVPNPYSAQTTIAYFLPQNTNSAEIIISTESGVELKTINLAGTGNGQIVFNGSSYASGVYLYTLIVDGKKIDTKRMEIVKN